MLEDGPWRVVVPTITLLDDEYVGLWYHPDSHIVHHKIRKFPSSESFRAMLTKGAEWLERYHASKWLSDDKNNVVVRDDDAHWGDTVWAPRVIAAGFKYWAIVLPLSAVGQLNMKRFAEEYRKRGVTVGTFDTVAAAERWLKAQG